MKNLLNFYLVFSLLITGSALSQDKLELKFDTFEMELVVNDKIVDHKIVGYDCALAYNYIKKDFIIAYTHKTNNKYLTLPFIFIKSENDEKYYRIATIKNKKSRFILRDSIYSKNKIEFINSVEEKNGEIVSTIYRFSK